MCLAVPGKIIKKTGSTVVVDYGVEQREAQLVNDEFVVGDYVVLQGGFVVMKIPEKEAEQSLELYINSLA